MRSVYEMLHPLSFFAELLILLLKNTNPIPFEKFNDTIFILVVYASL